MTDAEITTELFVRDEPVTADLALVFGAACQTELERRTRRAAELHARGYAPVLVLSGGPLADGGTEAARMAEIARSHGVGEDALLLEDRSASTFENVQRSSLLLQERSMLDDLATVILVSSEWHMRRALLTAERYFVAHPRFVCCPPLEGCTRESWTRSSSCRDRVLAEADLLASFREMGLL